MSTYTCHTAQLRCPVIGKSPNGQSIFVGYIHSTYETDLKSLRVKIEEVLREPSQGAAQKLSASFHFVHSYHYSIHRYNESKIILLDIMANKCIFIQFDPNPLDMLTMTTSNLMIQDKPYDDLGSGQIADQADGVKSKIVRKKQSM